MSINEVMAIRSTLLARSTALQNVARVGQVSIGTEPNGGPRFAAAMTEALGRTTVTTPNDGQAVAAVSSARPGDPTGLGSTFQAALEKLNGINAEAGTLTNAYERGETTDIAKVMLARQRAGIGFEATLQVRNKVLSAYKDIMGMAL